MKPPEVLFDFDGIPMAVLGHMTAREAFRVVWNDLGDYLCDALGWSRLPGSSRYHIPLSEYRSIIEGIKPGWYVCSETDPLDASRFGEWGEETWWPVGEHDDEQAVMYMDLRLS